MAANALAVIGPSASNAIPLALTDLTYESAAIRRQGLIILGGVGGCSEEAVSTLIRYTASDSELLQGTAVWGLGRITEANDSVPRLAALARSHLEALARGRGGLYVTSAARFALRLEPDGPQEHY
jgi:hypothetical protein